MKLKISFLICIFIIVAGVPGSLPLERKILDGVDIGENSMNYLASLHHLKTNVCTGFLINNEHIVTAAHCLEELIFAEYPDFKNHFALIGAENIYRGGTKYFYYFVQAHHEYKPKQTQPLHDIGIIKLMAPVDSRLYTNILKVANWDPVNSQIGMVGSWSSRPSLAYQSSYIGFVCFLRYIRATMARIKNYKCKRIIKENMIKVDDSMLCVVPHDDFPGAAFEQSDAGTPIVNVLQTTILGILAFVPKNRTRAAIFLKINEYQKWIEKVTSSENWDAPMRRTTQWHPCFEDFA